MKAFYEHGIFNHIREVIGISAGAFIGLLWVLEYTIPQIENLALEFDFTVLRNFEPESVLSFPLTFGLDDGSKIDKLIASVLKQKGFAPDATFEQVFTKYSMHFRCYTTELQTSKVREFSTFKSPKTSVKFAIRASMALPFFYTPIKDPKSNLLFVDGAVLHNLPLAFLKEDEIRETWGVLFTITPCETAEPIEDIMQVVRYIYDCSTVMKTAPYMERFGDRVICIPTGDFGTLQLGKTREERAELIQRAYRITKKFMYSLSKPRHRRFSAS
jgi:predicted acylesterase/phospholipase RssA